MIDVLVDHHVDGIIIAPAENTEAQIKQLKKRNFPFVLLDRNFTDLKVNYVGVNNYDAAYKATCHLIDTGRKRIGMIGFRTTLPNLADRKRGILKALEDRNVTLPKNALAEVSVDATKEEVDKAIAGMVSVSKPIDALFFASNKLSTFGLKYLNTTSLTVPGDLALCSFDESDATDLFYAPLTHIRQPLREMGEAAVHRLMQVIAGEKKVTQMLLEAELVLGPSTAK